MARYEHLPIYKTAMDLAVSRPPSDTPESSVGLTTSPADRSLAACMDAMGVGRVLEERVSKKALSFRSKLRGK